MKHKKVFYDFKLHGTLILLPTIIGYFSISAFISLVRIPIGIASSVVGLKICSIKAGIKNYNSWKMHDKIVLLAKTMLNTKEVLISRAYISHKEFVLEDNVLCAYNDIKEAIKNPKVINWNYV